MVEENKTTNEYITAKDLAEQTKTILEAVDFSLQKYSKKTNERFDRIDERLDRIDLRIDKVEKSLKLDIQNIQTLIDGYVKAQEDFKQDFVIMKEEMKQMKQIFKEKFGVEIRVF